MLIFKISNASCKGAAITKLFNSLTMNETKTFSWPSIALLYKGYKIFELRLQSQT